MPKKKAKTHWRNRSLAREGEPTQRTKTGIEIPVPTRSEWEGVLGAAAKKPEKPSRSAKAARRTRRAP